MFQVRILKLVSLTIVTLLDDHSINIIRTHAHKSPHKCIRTRSTTSLHRALRSLESTTTTILPTARLRRPAASALRALLPVLRHLPARRAPRAALVALLRLANIMVRRRDVQRARLCLERQKKGIGQLVHARMKDEKKNPRKDQKTDSRRGCKNVPRSRSLCRQCSFLLRARSAWGRRRRSRRPRLRRRSRISSTRLARA